MFLIMSHGDTIFIYMYEYMYILMNILLHARINMLIIIYVYKSLLMFTNGKV